MVRSALMVWMAIACSVGACSAGVKVTLKAEAEVAPARTIVVADIAAVTGPAELVRRAGQTALGTAPPPGQRRAIAIDYVRLRLAAVVGAGKAAVVGPDRVTVTGKCTKLSPDQLAEAARAFVEGQLPRDGRTYEVVVQRAPREVILPATADVRVSPRSMNGGARAGLNTVAIDIVADGKPAVTVSATVTVRAVADVLVASATIRQGEALTPKNTAWVRRDVTRIPDAVTQTGSEGSMDGAARRTISSGTVIRTPDIQPPPAVHRSDTVNLIVTCGGVRLRTTAESAQDGRVGETIRVRPEASDGEVRAKVVEPGLVEIER